MSLGALASEVKDSRTYRNAVMILMPIVALIGCLPCLVSLSVDDTREDYVAGHFIDIARELPKSGGDKVILPR